MKTIIKLLMFLTLFGIWILLFFRLNIQYSACLRFYLYGSVFHSHLVFMVFYSFTSCSSVFYLTSFLALF